MRKTLSKALSDKARLEQLVEVDPLTRVLNRRGLDQFLTRAISHTQRYHDQSSHSGNCVLLLDLDGMKAVNDHAGHPAGDAILVDIADRISSLIRKDDGIGRLGGDEFVLVMWNIGAAAARRKVDELDSVVGEIACAHNLAAQLLGASIGLTWLNAGDSPSAVIERADKDMYAVKRMRRLRRANEGQGVAERAHPLQSCNDAVAEIDA